MGWVLAKTLLFTIVAPGTVTILVPYLILSRLHGGNLEIGTVRYVGLIPLAAGIAIYFWCAWGFASTGKGTPAPIDPPKQLVVHGLYRFTRNPMYVGILSIVVGETLFFASLWLLGYLLVLFTGFHLFVVAYEEPTLTRMFGESYKQYCRRVPRWLLGGREGGVRVRREQR